MTERPTPRRFARPPFSVVSVVAAAFVATFLPSGRAQGAGLYFSDRGVRPMGRAGAFVAGADDAGSVWYNPAGLSLAKTSLLVDFSYLRYTSTFERRDAVADNAGAVHIYEFPRVQSSTPFLPLPTLAGSWALGSDEKVSVGFGVFAPYAALTSYPAKVDGVPSPSRYSLVSLDGSTLANVLGTMAFAVTPKLRVGAGLGAVVGAFQSRVVFSASPPYRLLGAPEDPNFDAESVLKVGPIVAPTGNIGIQFDALDNLRLGASAQAPAWINAPATVDVRLPDAIEFDRARQDGNEATVRFKLPPIVRVGVEFRPVPSLRIEAAYVREFWSIHESIDVRPKDIAIVGLVGLPSPFAVSPISLPRNFSDAGSYRVGGEFSFPVGRQTVDVRAGVSYDESAVPTPYLSALTVDLAKVMVTAGASVHFGRHWRVDALFAQPFTFSRSVPTGDARIGRVNPVQGNPTRVEAVNGGNYAVSANLFGLGAAYKF
jgi:long-chain fatty acid transport protein